MVNSLFIVTTPQIGVNEDRAVLIEWSVADEDFIKSGEKLCLLETSKALIEFEAEISGYIIRLVEVNSEITVSQPIALIGSDIELLKREKQKYLSKKTAEELFPEYSVKSTKKARIKARELHVNLCNITTKGIIREQDVIDYHQAVNKINNLLPLPVFTDFIGEAVMIYGTGHGAVNLKECLDNDSSYKVICFIDDNPMHSLCCGLPVYHSSHITELRHIKHVACEIANGKRRLEILSLCNELGLDLINVIHPSAFIAPSATIGKGNYIKAGVIIDTNTVIGNCCIIDNGVIIPHDNLIGNGCHIAPGVVLGSSVTIGDLAIIGIGSSVATGITIGTSAIISVGTSVVKDTGDYNIVEGVPGKVIGKRK